MALRAPILRFGANYIPSRNWLYSWLDWDRASISEDLQAIASLGMDHIRAHLLWPVFQPNEAWVNQQALDRLEELLDICESCNLDAEVTVLSGWMSGTAYYPSWKKSDNFFTSPRIRTAQKLLFRALADRIGAHPRFLGFDLGNELSVLPHCGDPVSIAEGDAWLRDIAGFCDELAPAKFHVNGVDHIPWFSDAAFSRQALSSVGAATSLHTWILFTGAMDLYRPLRTGCTGIAEYCIELAHAYSTDPDRKVWIQEFGASPLWMDADLIPEFAEQTIRRAVSCRNLWGLTWWCSHDIDRRFGGFDPLEHGLGLFTVRNEAKPVARGLAALIREFRETPAQPLPRTMAVVLPDGPFPDAGQGRSSHDKVGWSFAGPYMDFLERDVRPAVVLESRIEDKEYLRARGIERTMELRDNRSFGSGGSRAPAAGLEVP